MDLDLKPLRTSQRQCGAGVYSTVLLGGYCLGDPIVCALKIQCVVCVSFVVLLGGYCLGDPIVCALKIQCVVCVCCCAARWILFG